MTTVVFDTSMSLDGYMTATNRTADEPMGMGGDALHDWAYGADPVGRDLKAAATDRLGAVITGRAAYDHWVPWWGADGPTGPARRPVFVVTHEAPEKSPARGVYEFVTGGIEEALKRATVAAGSRVVSVLGGAKLGQQYIQAGLIDEIAVHLVPVLFGSGTRMFENMDIDHIRLEVSEVVHTPAATHLRYRVLKRR